MGNSKPISILDLCIILLEKKKLLIYGMIAVSVAAVIVTTLLPKYYTAQALILPSSPKLAGGLGSLLEDSPVSGLLESLDLVDMGDNDEFITILESRRLAEMVVNKFDLVTRYKFHKRRRYYIENLLKEYYKNLDIVVTDLGNIQVSFTDKDPQFAAEAANFIVAQLDSISYQVSKDAAKNSRIFFENRLQLITEELNSANEKFNKFKLEHGYLDFEEQLKATIKALAEVEAQKMAADIEIDQTREQLGNDASRVRELKRQRAVLMRRMDNYMEKGSGDLIIALNKAPALGVEYGHHYRDVLVQEMLYKYILQMYEQAKFIEANNTPVVKVLEHAWVPQKKVRPKRSILCILSFFCGFILLSIGILANKWYSVQKEQQTEIFGKLQVIFSHLRLRK